VQAQMPLPIQHGALQSTTLVLPGESGGSEWKRNGQEASADTSCKEWTTT